MRKFLIWLSIMAFVFLLFWWMAAALNHVGGEAHKARIRDSSNALWICLNTTNDEYELLLCMEKQGFILDWGGSGVAGISVTEIWPTQEAPDA